MPQPSSIPWSSAIPQWYAPVYAAAGPYPGSANWTSMSAPYLPVRQQILDAFNVQTMAGLMGARTGTGMGVGMGTGMGYAGRAGTPPHVSRGNPLTPLHPQRRYRYGIRGLGHATPHSPHSLHSLGSLGSDTSQIVMSLPTITGATLSTASALGAGWATAAIPFVGPAIAGVTVALSLLFARKGPKQKVATTKIVDAVEPYMKENLAGYFAGPRTKSSQAQALANFDAGWQYVQEHCNIPEMGDPGQRCTSDRQSGACVWKDSNGQCWNWFIGYRDPIANDTPTDDPTVQTITNPTTGAQTQVTVDSAGNVVSATDSTSSSTSGSGVGGDLSSILSGSMLPILAVGAVILGLSMGGDR